MSVYTDVPRPTTKKPESEVSAAAIECASAGLSVVPIDSATKRPTCRWKVYQSAIADEATIHRWGDIRAVAVVCGLVSGGLLCLDFDVADRYPKWRERVGALADGLPVQRTGGGGYQVFVRCPAPGGNVKLAWARDDGEPTGRTVAIETRGEGGYAIIPPSLHPSGNRYAWVTELTVVDVPTVTQEVADRLLAAARELDEMPEPRAMPAPAMQETTAAPTPAPVPPSPTAEPADVMGSVIHAYDHAHPIETMLEAHGYTPGRSRDRFIRPGGKSESVHILDGRSYHHSSNDPMNDGHAHDAFDLFCRFEHGGNMRLAVKAAARELGMELAGDDDAEFAAMYGAQAGSQAGRQAPPKSRANGRKAAAANETQDDLPLLGERDPKTKKLVLSPRRTLPTARAYIREHHLHPDGRTVHCYAGVAYQWDGNRYQPAEDAELRNRLQPWLHGALRVVEGGDGRTKLKPFDANPTTVNAALETIRNYVHLPITLTPPAWIDGRGPDPRDLLAFPGGMLVVPTGEVLPPSPRLFTTTAIDFEYAPNPEPPEQWIRFLEQLFGDDLESVATLQEWFGLCLVGDTSQQKMLLLVGPRRSGKGTIARILTELVGRGNVTGPTTSSLAGPFGLQPLIELKAWQGTLSKPRCPFVWKAGGRILWDIGAADDEEAQHKDRGYGPKPRVCSVARTAGGLSARIEFEIEATVAICASGTPNDIEEFTWAFSYSFNRNFVCTRKVHGTFRVAAPLNAASTFLPQGDLFPAVLDGFYRDSIEHSLSPDGLVLTWSITDKQVWRTLPHPLTDGTATFSVDVIGAAMTRRRLSCSFAAPMDVDKSVIFQFIYALIQYRFPTLFSRYSCIPKQLSITNHEFENRIDCTVVTEEPITVTLPGKTPMSLTANDAAGIVKAAQAGGFAFPLFGDIANVMPNTKPVFDANGNLTFEPEARGDTWRPSDGRSERRAMTGTAGIIPEPSPILDRCGADPVASIETAMAPAGDAVPARQSSPDYQPQFSTDALPEPGSAADGSSHPFSQQHENAPYASYHETLRYILDMNAVVIPVMHSGSPDIVQRTAAPTVRVIQIGHARRFNLPPEFGPLYVSEYIGQPASADRAQLIRHEVSNGAPQIQVDGQSVLYSSTWCYEVALPTVRALTDEAPADETKIIPKVGSNRIFDDQYFKNNLDARPRTLGTINSSGGVIADGSNRQP